MLFRGRDTKSQMRPCPVFRVLNQIVNCLTFKMRVHENIEDLVTYAKNSFSSWFLSFKLSYNSIEINIAVCLFVLFLFCLFVFCSL